MKRNRFKEKEHKPKVKLCIGVRPDMYGLQRYLGIEQEFITAQQYVDLSIESAFSEFFTREVILLGVEIEAAFKELCSRINGSTAGNMADYKSIILGEYTNLANIYVRNKRTGAIYYPFQGWDIGPLPWWSVYVQVKHNLIDRAATVGVALSMLRAYELLLFCVEATNGNISVGYMDMPKLFIPEFEPGMTLENDMSFTLKYSGNEIRQRLKGLA